MKMQLKTLSIPITALSLVLVLAGCSTQEKKIQYPFFRVKDIKGQADDCDSLDRYLQQVDSVRWSMRKDGIELETKFEQMVQLSLATVGAIAVAPAAYYTATPELVVMPYTIAYTNPDKLKNSDALLIALMSKRQELGCEPHRRCRVSGDQSGTLFKLGDIRQRVESGDMSEARGIVELTRLLDELCPEGEV
jgi:hypothetical protein